MNLMKLLVYLEDKPYSQLSDLWIKPLKLKMSLASLEVKKTSSGITIVHEDNALL